MRVTQAMTRGYEAVKAGASLQEAAQQMRDHDIGALIVNGDDGQVAGIITDRDIAVRAVAAAASADSPVSPYMSGDVISCYQDDDLAQAAGIMEQQQIRRLLVCDNDDQPVGMLAQADLALALGRAPLTGEMLRDISQPSEQPSQRH